ncbi:MAG: glycerophosphodiester phosphodiesterase family protein [Patescibacteria group bacterium]
MIKVVGHRGAAAYEPENTISSFKKAINIGVDEIEFDIQLTKDKVPIVFHDDFVDRITNKRGCVADMTLAKIKKINVEKKEKIPTLEKILKFLKNFDQNLQIELKGPNTEKSALKLIKQLGMLDKVTFSSFWHERVKTIKDLEPKAKTGIIVSDRPLNPVKMLKEVKADNLHIRKSYITKDLVKLLHQNNKKVFAWNADSEKEIEELAKCDVDFIGSNKPDIAIKILKKLNKR